MYRKVVKCGLLPLPPCISGNHHKVLEWRDYIVWEYEFQQLLLLGERLPLLELLFVFHQ
jgi:hypothetical protein